MNNIIEEFYDKEKDNYNLSLKEFNLICKAPFLLVKEVMNKGILKDIRFQYFGIFKVSSNRVKYTLSSLEESYSKGNISEKRYLERKQILENYESKN